MLLIKTFLDIAVWAKSKTKTTWSIKNLKTFKPPSFIIPFVGFVLKTNPPNLTILWKVDAMKMPKLSKRETRDLVRDVVLSWI